MSLLALSRSLTPACCKILVGLMFAGKALDMSELELWSGLERMALGRGLRVLDALGLVARQRMAHNRYVWLPAGDTLQLMQNASTGSSSSRVLTTSSEEELVLLGGQLMQTTSTGAVLDVLSAAGIREPARSRLAGLDHVTAALVRGHVDQVRQEGQGLGLAVYRIEHNWPLKESRGSFDGLGGVVIEDGALVPFTAPYCLHFEAIDGDADHGKPCQSREVAEGQRYCAKHLGAHVSEET